MRRFVPKWVIERVALLLINIFFTLSALATIPSTSAAAENPGPAEAAVRQMLDSISKLRTTENKEAKSELIKKVDSSLALDSLSQKALGAQWGKLDSTQRERFARLLRELLEKLAYPQASQFFTGLEVEYGTEQVKDGQTVVPTTVKRREGGAVSIDYVLARKGAQWRVVDIVLDGQSLASNVEGQIQAVLKQGSYDSLIAQMEAKLKQPGS